MSRYVLPPTCGKLDRDVLADLLNYLLDETGSTPMAEAWDEIVRAGLNEVRARRAMEREVV